MKPIPHHGFFQVYIPKSENDWDDPSELLLVESYLSSKGELTPNFQFDDSDRENYQVLLYPSFIHAANKLYFTAKEKYDFINGCLDSEFIKMILWIQPLHRALDFIDLHYSLYAGDKVIFIRHIKFEIIPKIKQFLEDSDFLKWNKHAESIDFENIKGIIMDWVRTKENKGNNTSVDNTTTIHKAKNVVLNNSSTIQEQHTNTKTSKRNYALLGIVIAFLSLLVAIIVNWDKIFKL